MNELEKRAKYHKKRQKGIGAFVKLDAGNVPYNIAKFNNSTNTKGGMCATGVSTGVGESLQEDWSEDSFFLTVERSLEYLHKEDPSLSAKELAELVMKDPQLPRELVEQEKPWIYRIAEDTLLGSIEKELPGTSLVEIANELAKAPSKAAFINKLRTELASLRNELDQLTYQRRLVGRGGAFDSDAEIDEAYDATVKEIRKVAAKILVTDPRLLRRN